MRISKKSKFSDFSALHSNFSHNITPIFKTIRILINDRVSVLLDYVCIGFLELFCLKYRCNQIVFVMKAKKSENTTYPSSKVKLHRATKQFEGRWNSSGKDPMQSKSGPSLHHLIRKSNYFQNDATLLYCFHVIFSFSCLSSSCFHYFIEPVFQKEKLPKSHSRSYQVSNTNPIIE